MGISKLRSVDLGDPISAFDRAAAIAAHGAQRLDEISGPPKAEVGALFEARLLSVPFSAAFGGIGLARGDAAARLLPGALRCLGRASLPLGRLYEGHVNAVRLLETYGSRPQTAGMAEEVRLGALLGVWAADGNDGGLRICKNGSSWRLEGRKIYCSGATIVTRPIVTAKDELGQTWIVVPRLTPGQRVDLSGWTAQGMRASLTGAVDLSGITIDADAIVGHADAYHREPEFSGGAWRFLAVHLGGMEALLDGLKKHLIRTKRGCDPHQAARLSQSAVAVETARLWVERAAGLFERREADAASIVAYVNLARAAVERAALDLIELVQRSVGLEAFLWPNPIERVTRDLATYLRQPGPDRAMTSAASWLLSEPCHPRAFLT
jgi:alkylation response protein AidB-like acyl-CoA dehydrogenase